MGAFDGLRIPYDRTTDGEDPEPGPAHYPGSYNDEISNTPYLYPWGRKERNPFFIGPYPYGPTPLIAAMRCYVASKLGEEVEIPDEHIV